MKATLQISWRGRIPFFKTLSEVKIVVDDVVYQANLADVPQRRRTVLQREGAVLQTERFNVRNYPLLINDVPVAEIDYRYGWNETFALIWRGEVYRIVPKGARKFCESLDAYWLKSGEAVFNKQRDGELQEYRDIAAFIIYLIWEAWRLA